MKDSFYFTKKLLEATRSGKIKYPKDEVQAHLRKTYSDLLRNKKFPLAEPKDPEVVFDITEAKLKEVTNIIRKARAKSAPGPNQIHTWSTRTAHYWLKDFGDTRGLYGGKVV